MAIEIIKRPLGIGQFVWSMSKKDGKYKILIGPDPLEATDDDIFFISDSVDPKKIVPVGNPGEAIQDFITLKTNEYAVLHSPSETTSVEYPNANYSSGKNDMKPLLRGQKRTITSGHFPLWPGQSVEIRKVHGLSSNQYLMVVVESNTVDVNAPYYDITIKCAGIKKAVVDETVASEDSEKIKIGVVKEAESLQSGTKEGETDSAGSPGGKGNNETRSGGKESVPMDIVLKVGQKIIIPGSLTPTYIPPTGIEVVSEGENEETAEDDPLTFPQDFIEKMIDTGALKIENLKGFMEKAGLDVDYADEVTRYYTSFRRDNEGKKALNRAISGVVTNTGSRDIYSKLAKILAGKAKNSGKSDLAVRKAVVLGPTEFCVLFDEDGKPRTHKGPGRVFPGPYDIFRIEGSRNRIYDAYHLREDRGLLLRVVADKISRTDLIKQLPEGSAKSLEGKETYEKGDEIFIGGFDAYLVPSNSIEVINPETRQPHIGNDHSEVYVQSIGVDQKSGVYVASVATGNVKLEKGEKKLLLDPRKEKHIKRRIPREMWNLIIAKGEAHKATDQRMVETPWALSVIIPNNEAALVTGKDSRRVVVGPRTELLGYEEWLEVLTLSKGRPKLEESILETCFLRVTGNRITDQIELETSDFVRIKIDVCYGVEFEGKTQEEMAKWFNHINYVMLLCNNLRSRLKLAARKISLKNLYPDIPDFVRNTILGEKPTRAEEGKETHRPGLKFDENNMLVNEVEVLSVTIPDSEIATAIVEQNRTIIKGEMEVATSKANLESAKAKDAIDEEISMIQIEKADRDKETGLKVAKSQHEVEKKKKELAHQINKLIQENQAAIDKAMETATNVKAELVRTRESDDAKAMIARDGEKHKKIIEFRTALKEIQIALIDAESNADVARLGAVQNGLIEALEGLGNKELATALAKNLPQATGSLGLLLGQGGLDAVLKMVKGTKLEGAINALKDSAKTIEKTSEQIGKAAGEDTQ
ncbi:MAG: hypothetical protein WA055_05005 [Candidatus Moraniibacteriota bacterium]